MKKYFLKVGDEEQGPFTPEELKDKGIAAGSLVRQEGADALTAAEQTEELRSFFELPELAATEIVTTATDTAVTGTQLTLEASPEIPITAAAVAGATSAESPKKQHRKKGNPVITWALSLAAIAGTGYFVYQDMEKNKTSEGKIAAADENGGKDEPAEDNKDLAETNEDNTGANQDAVPVTDDGEPTANTDTVKTDPVTTTAKTLLTTDLAAQKKSEEEKKKLLAAQVKKKEEAKKQQLATTEAKQKELERQQQIAAQAALEMEMRNGWPRYVSIGTFKKEGDDKVKPFNIPVYNGFPVPVEKVTLRVDYLKKEGKVVESETVVVTDIPARGSRQVLTAGNKKARTANVYITGITSRQLHFCYPSGSGKQGDVYYCN